MIIDTHCHLDFPDFDKDRREVIERARGAGVSFMVNVGSSVDGSLRSLELAREYPEIYATVGVHPHYARDVEGKVPGRLTALLKEDKVVAVGEVGLDYYRDLSPRDEQRMLFIDSITLAKEKDLPLIIHTRSAHGDTLAILKDNFKRGAGRGVMHCFSGSAEEMEEYLDLGFHISFTCSLTFPNADAMRSVAGAVPSERLLIETDAPFMAPRQYRGKRNEPAYLAHLVKELAGCHGLSEEDVARITAHNAGELFRLPLEEPSRIAYSIRDSLYLNITNDCTNDCDFCVRRYRDSVKGHRLRLTREPALEEIMAAAAGAGAFREVVFCGYGEPTLRLDAVKPVARYLKDKGVKVRMVTNGQGSLIHKRDIVPELAGLIDRVSVSLNVDSSEMYDRVCMSRFGRGAYEKVKEFAAAARDAGIDVEVTFLDLPGVDKARCESIARDELGVRFRMRRLDNVG